MANARLLIVTHLLAAGAGYTIAPRELLESEVVSSGFFRTDTKRTLAAAVESLRTEARLVAFSYKGFAAVSMHRTGPLGLDARQSLIVPANVDYMLDLSDLDASQIDFDEEQKQLTIYLPALTLGDITFDVVGAQTTNSGLLTFSQAEVDRLSRENFRSAKRAFIKSAQSPTLVLAARSAAEAQIASTFRLALRAAGRSDVRVSAHFGNRPQWRAGKLAN
jgi:hypothetical protein